MHIKHFLLFASLFFTTFSFAQKKKKPIIKKAATAEPALPGQINSLIPDFTIRRITDSTAFKRMDLEKGKKTIILYFGPECGHCTYFTKRMMDSIDLFKNTQILMVSSFAFDKVKKFHEDYKLGTVPFITTGTDNYYFVTNFGIRSFPSAYIYNTKGVMVKFLESEFSIKEMAEAN